MIAQRLQHCALTDEFLELLDLTEWALRRATQQAAQEHGLPPRGIWDEALRIYGGVLRHGKLSLPFEGIVSNLRARWMYPAQEQPCDELVNALLPGVECDQPSHLALLMLLQGLERQSQPDLDLSIRLARRAADTKLHTLRLCAVQLLQSTAHHVMTVCPERRHEAVAILEGMLPPGGGVDLIGALDALSAYGAFSSPVSLKDATQEVREIISGAIRERLAPLLALEPSLTIDDAVAEQAWGLVACIFEEVFEGVYYAAYEELTDQEKSQFLAYALRSPRTSMHTTWMLAELLRLQTVDANPVFGRYAAGVGTDEFIRQEAVASFILGVIGWARDHDQAHQYCDQSTRDHRTWAVMGQLIHAIYRSMPREQLEWCWEQLASQPALTVAGVLYHMGQAMHVLHDYRDIYAKLLESGPGHLRQILAEALMDWERFLPEDRRAAWLEGEIVQSAISALGVVGDRTTISTLARWADDPVHGKDAILAITILRRAQRTEA